MNKHIRFSDLKYLNATLDFIARTSDDALFVMDSSKTILAWNAKLEAMTGISRLQALERQPSDVGGSFFLSFDFGPVESVFANRTEQTGSLFTFDKKSYVVSVALLNTDEQADVAIVRLRPYESDLQNSVLLNETENRFRSMADEAPVLLWMAGTDGLCNFFNHTWLKFTGRPLAQEYGVGWAEGVHFEDFQFCMDTYLAAFRTRKSFSMEYRLRRHDGQYRWVLDRGLPRYSNDGTFQGYIGSCIDITEIKTAQSLLERNQEQLKFLDSAAKVLTGSLNAEQLYARLAEQMTKSFCDWCFIDLIDEAKVLTRVAVAGPQAADKTLVAELKNLHFDLDDVTLSAEAVRTKRALLFQNMSEEFVASRTAFPTHTALLQKIGPKSAIVVPILLHARLLGAITFIISSARYAFDELDVALCEELARRLALAIENANLYEHAQVSNRMKDEFLATLSHELRTPMTSILGWANMLRGGLVDKEAFRVGLESIEKNALAQTTLIEDILDVSRIITGRMVLDAAPTEVIAVLENAISSVSVAAEAKKIRIERAFEPSIDSISADSVRLQQVFWNVLSNAIKFSEPGHVVRVKLKREQADIAVVFEDEGEGIDAAFLPHVFERFRQQHTGSRKRFGGLGLGLAIARHLVELHGGSIEAHSEGKGLGTTITIRLPVLTARQMQSAEDNDPASKADRAGAQSGWLNGLRVMVVDDAEDVRQMVSFIMRTEGAAALVAESVEEAFDRLRLEPIDFVFCDIGMPINDGYEFIRRFRKEFGDTTPVAALTAFASANDKKQILQSGFTEHVAKPAVAQKLVEVVLKFCASKEGRAHAKT